MADRDARGVRRSVVRAAGSRATRTDPRVGVPSSRAAAEPTTAPIPLPPPGADQTRPPAHPGHPADPVDPPAEPPTDPGEPGQDLSDDAGDPGERPAEILVPLGSLVAPDLPDGFVTEAQLDDADAEASRLRELAEETRRLLDTPLPPVAAYRRRDKKLGVAALVAGGAAGVIAAGFLVPWSDVGGSSARNSSPDTIPVRPAAAPQTAGQPAPTAPAAFLPPKGVLPATGPGITTPGTAMTVRVLANGDLSVVEQAVLGPRGLRAIQLALPSLTAIGGPVGQLHPQVSGLRAAVNDQGATISQAGAGWNVASAQRARTVRLSYRLSGTTIRSTPSESGRAISVLVPLLAQTLRAQGLPLTVRSYATKVNAVSCPGAPPAQILCGMQVSTGWSATVPAAASSPALLMSVTL